LARILSSRSKFLILTAFSGNALHELSGRSFIGGNIYFTDADCYARCIAGSARFFSRRTISRVGVKSFLIGVLAYELGRSRPNSANLLGASVPDHAIRSYSRPHVRVAPPFWFFPARTKPQNCSV